MERNMTFKFYQPTAVSGTKQAAYHESKTAGSFFKNFLPGRKQSKADTDAKANGHPENRGNADMLPNQQEPLESKPPKLRGTSRLCKNTTVKGELVSGENLIIDGSLDGPVKSEGDVIIAGKVKGNVVAAGKCNVSQGGEVIGDIVCKNAEISGTLHGNLSAESCVVLLDGAVMQGDIVAVSIRTAAKAQVKGHLDIGQAITSIQDSEEKSDMKRLAAQNESRETADAVLHSSVNVKKEI